MLAIQLNRSKVVWFVKNEHRVYKPGQRGFDWRVVLQLTDLMVDSKTQ